MLIIGIPGCGECSSLREELDRGNTPYQYREFKELSLVAQRRIAREFRDETGTVGFPVVIRENEEEYL